MAKFRTRVYDYYLKYGLLKSLSHGIYVSCKYLSFIILQKVRNTNFIFRYNPDSDRFPIAEDVTIKKFNSINEIPTSLMQLIEKRTNASSAKHYLLGVEKYGCQLWLAEYKGNPACYLLCRKGSAIPYWFIPLGDMDVVIMMLYTLDEYRGKGLSPMLMQYIADTLVTNGITMYSDCKVHNLPSIRSMEKTGFEIIGKERGISEKWR